jgi:hypothetical protein
MRFSGTPLLIRLHRKWMSHLAFGDQWMQALRLPF